MKRLEMETTYLLSLVSEHPKMANLWPSKEYFNGPPRVESLDFNFEVTVNARLLPAPWKYDENLIYLLSKIDPLLNTTLG